MAPSAKLSEEPYGLEDRDLLFAVARQMSLSLENVELLEVAKREAEQAREPDIARNVQRGLFPQELPRVAGWDVAAVCRPARAVGGDYYDLFQLGDHHLVLALGDVSGKGLGPSLLMSNVQATVRSRLQRPGMELSTLMEEMSALLFSSTSPEMFITLFLGVLDLDTGELRYVNGGHNPPMVQNPGCEAPGTLETGGMIVGMMPGSSYEEGVAFLAPGSRLTVYSDGVTEARNPKGDMFGEERLWELLRGGASVFSHDVVSAVLQSVGEFAGELEQEDDISLIVMRRAASD